MGGPESEVFPSFKSGIVAGAGVTNRIEGASMATCASTHFTNEGATEVIFCFNIITSSSQHFFDCFLEQWCARAFLQQAGRLTGIS